MDAVEAARAQVRTGWHANVRPRYSPGSPALVHGRIAVGVARDEIRGIEVALEGFWGEAQKARAERLGLRGIAELKREQGSGKKHGWDILDLCTGERLFRLTDEALRKTGWRSWHDLAPWEQALAEAAAASVEDPKRGHYKIVPDGALPGYGRGYKAELYEPTVTSPAPAGWAPTDSQIQARWAYAVWTANA